jgi:Flp pilus assembly protein TadG
VRTTPLGRRDDGAAAVEFALVVPLLILLVFGIINFGVLFSQQLTLNNAVREGARGTVVKGTSLTCKQVRTAVSGALSGLAMTPGSVLVKTTTVTPAGATSSPCGTTALAPAGTSSQDAIVPCTGTADGDTVTVEGTYTAKVMAPLPPFPSSLTLTAKAVYRCEFH